MMKRDDDFCRYIPFILLFSTVILDGFRKERMCVRNQERKKKKGLTDWADRVGK